MLRSIHVRIWQPIRNLRLRATPNGARPSSTPYDSIIANSKEKNAQVLPRIFVSQSSPNSVNPAAVARTDGQRGGCVTLSDIYTAGRNLDGTSGGPLYILRAQDKVVNTPHQVITGCCLLTSDLYITDGITLLVWGTSYAGDADVLRLESTWNTFYNLRGYGGRLSFFHTVVSCTRSEGLKFVAERYSLRSLSDYRCF